MRKLTTDEVALRHKIEALEKEVAALNETMWKRTAENRSEINKIYERFLSCKSCKFD